MQFSPFEDHKELSSKEIDLSKLVEPSNNFSFPEFRSKIYVELQNNNETEICKTIVNWLTKTWSIDDKNINQSKLTKILANFLKSKSNVVKLKRSLSNFNIDFRKLFVKDFIKKITNSNIIKVIVQFLEFTDKRKNVILNAIQYICKDYDAIYLQFIDNISLYYLKSIDLFEYNNKVNITNIKNLFLIKNTDAVYNLYIELFYYNYIFEIDNDNLDNYDIMVNEIFPLIKNIKIEINKSKFNKIVYILNKFYKFLNVCVTLNVTPLYYHNNKLYEFIFDLITLTNNKKLEINNYEKLCKSINKNIVLLSKNIINLINNNTIEYLCVAIHNNFFNDNYDNISNINNIFEFLKKYNKLLIFSEFYKIYLSDRYLRSTNFNLEAEKSVLSVIDKECDSDLTQIFSDIENSKLCTENLHNITIIQKASNSIIDVKKLNPYYIANTNDNDNKNIKIKNEELANYIKISKKFFEKSITRSPVNLFLDNGGYYKYTININNHNITFESTLIEFNILNCFKNLNERTLYSIQMDTNFTKIEVENVINKFIFLNMIKKTGTKIFQFGNNIEKEEEFFSFNKDFIKTTHINLFNYSNYKIEEKKEEVIERTEKEKHIITKLHIMKIIKGKESVIKNSVYCQLVERVKPYFEMKINIFIKAYEELQKKEYLDIKTIDNKPVFIYIP